MGDGTHRRALLWSLGLIVLGIVLLVSLPLTSADPNADPHEQAGASAEPDQGHAERHGGEPHAGDADPAQGPSDHAERPGPRNDHERARMEKPAPQTTTVNDAPRGAGKDTESVLRDLPPRVAAALSVAPVTVMPIAPVPPVAPPPAADARAAPPRAPGAEGAALAPIPEGLPSQAAPAPSPAPSSSPSAPGPDQDPLDPSSPIEGTPTRRRPLLARLFAIFPALALGWRRVSKNTALSHDVRASMVARLRERPGAHLRGLARELGLTPQNASYHLHQLETCGLVSSATVGRKRVFYPTEGGRRMRTAAQMSGALVGAQRTRVLAAVLREPGIHEGALARTLGIRHGSASWTARQLVKAGFLTPAPCGNRVGYYATPEGTAALASLDVRRAIEPATSDAALPA